MLSSSPLSLFPVWHESSMKFLSGGPWNVQSHYHPLSSPDHLTWQKSENFVCSPKRLLLFLDFPTLSSFPIPYPLVWSIWEESCDPWNTKVDHLRLGPWFCDQTVDLETIGGSTWEDVGPPILVLSCLYTAILTCCVFDYMDDVTDYWYFKVHAS